MLSLSTSTNSLSDTTSLAASVELDLVEEIIGRHRHATSFPQIFRPYTDVLQEHGISPTADTAYYNFLLKVGTIRAPTWGDKWDIWKATHSANVNAQASSSSSNPSTSINDESIARSLSLSKSKIAEVRARVPFLASASSDLDEGYGEDPEPEIEGEGESLIQPTRTSPRRYFAKKREARQDTERERRNVSSSLVGYTPTQSMALDLDLDLLSFNPPIRTSTPVFGHHPRPGLFPPAYSESDISQSLENFSALGLSTPKQQQPRIEAWTTDTAAKILQTPSSKSKSSSLNIKDLPYNVRQEMERRADEFYEMGLMGRCWDMWSKTSEWYRVAYKNITVARDNLLLREVLEKWRTSTQHQLSLPGTADSHRKHHLQSLVLQTWLTKLKEREMANVEKRWKEEKHRRTTLFTWKKWAALATKRRKDRWEKDMARREEEFGAAKRTAMLYRILTYWRVEVRSRIAISTANLQLVKPLFDHWHDLTLQTAHLNALVVTFEREKMRETFYTWRRRLILAPLETELVAHHDQKLVRKVWDDWRISKWQVQQSAIFDKRRLLLLGLEKWRKVQQAQQTLEDKAVAHDRRRLLRTTYKHWKIESWGQLLLHIRESRVQHRVWTQWTTRQSHLDDMRGLAADYASLTLRNKAQTLFSLWRSRLGTNQTNLLRAQLVHEIKLRSFVMDKWRSATNTIHQNVEVAEKAHAFFLLRTTVGVWRSELGRVKQVDFVERKKVELVQRVFERWKHLTGKYTELDRKEAVLHQKNDQRIKRRLLARWTERIVEVKDRELKIARARDVHVLSTIIQKWRDAAARVRSYDKLAEDSIEIRENEQLRRAFRSWRARAKREKRLRILADSAVERRKSRLVRNAWERWYGLKRERELSPIEHEVSLRREDALLFNVWDNWRLSTRILPGIIADSQRIKRRTIHIWVMALVRKVQSEEMRKERDTKLLAEAFGLWKDATAHKVSLNAKRVRGRTRPSARLSLEVGDQTRRTSNSSSTPGSRIPFPIQTRGTPTLPTSALAARKVTPTLTTSKTSRLIHFSQPQPQPQLQREHQRSVSAHRESTPIHTSPSLVFDKDERIGSSETVLSEPIYSRLRNELHRTTTTRRVSNEHEPQPRPFSPSSSKPTHTSPASIERPKSGSEMLRTLRGSMPGR